jgi:hypothetical protein
MFGEESRGGTVEKRQDEEQGEGIMPLITAVAIVREEGMRWGRNGRTNERNALLRDPGRCK